jgi:FkbM family methyltransferase
VNIRHLVKRIAPPIVLDAVRALRQSARGPDGTAAGPSPRELAHRRLNEGNTQNEMTFRDGLRITLRPGSVFAFEHFCFRDDVMVDEMDTFLAASAGRQRLLDVGALHGVFSIPFAIGKPERRVLAVDASPLAFAHLLYNLHANNVRNVTPVESAISDGEGILEMHYEWQHLVSAGTAVTADENVIRVRKRSGDDLCAEHGFEPDVVKVDVEGHEVRVLRGLWRTLEQCRPLIFLEVHPARIRSGGDDAGEIVRQLAPLGYTARRIGGGPVPLDAIASFTVDERLVLEPCST